MLSQSNVEAFGVIFNFEPPVPLRDDEPNNPSLARLATIAWLGTEFPYGICDQACVESFDGLFEELQHNPRQISESITKALNNQFVITFEKS